jgi:hypothetical protein
MGIFDRIGARLGGVDEHLIATGTLARGNVRSCDPTSMSTGRAEKGTGLKVICKVTVEVIGLQGEEPYEASCLHPIPQVYLPRMMDPGAAVAIRVDPADPQHIALDLDHDVPPAPIVLVSDDGTKQAVETNKATYTTAELLSTGRPCTLLVSAVFPLGQLTQAGLPASGLILQVQRDGAAPYQAQVGLHIPDAAARIVVQGAQLPGKWLPGPGLPTDVNLVTIDFPALGIPTG